LTLGGEERLNAHLQKIELNEDGTVKLSANWWQHCGREHLCLIIARYYVQTWNLRVVDKDEGKDKFDLLQPDCLTNERVIMDFIHVEHCMLVEMMSDDRYACG
jgi:hypothetical protein